MSKTLPVLTIVGGVFALLSALIFVNPASLLTALFAVTAAVFLFLRKDRVGVVMGSVAVVLTILGVLGQLESISTQGGGGVAFGISSNLGQAFLIMAALVPAGALLWVDWDMFALALATISAALLGIAAIIALAMNGDLTDQTAVGGYLAGIVGLVGALIPAMVALRTPA